MSCAHRLCSRFGQPFHVRAALVTTLLLAASALPLHAQLVLGMEVNPDPAEPNELVELRARVSNTGVATSGALTLRLEWPANMGAFPQVTGAGSVYCPGGQCTVGELLQWNLGTLAAGATQAISVAVPVGAAAPADTVILFEVELVEGGMPAGTIDDDLIVKASRALELAVDPLADPAAPGDQLAYDLSFANKSGALATGAELRLPLPAGTTFVSATGGGMLSGGDVVWNLGTLAIASSGKRRAVVAVNGGLASGSLLSVDAATLGAVVSAVAHQTRATAVSRVASGATVQLALEINPDPAQPNELVELRARVSNLGGSPTGALTLRLHWPDHLGAFPQVTGTGVAYCPGGQCNPSELLTWSLGSLPAQGSQTVTFSVALGAVASGTLIPLELSLANAVSVASLGHAIAVQANRPLELAIDALSDPVAPGGQLAYDLSFGNKSGAVATAAELRMPLPEGTTFVSATGGGTLSGGDVVWNVGTIPVASGGKRRAVVAVDGGLASGSLLTVDAVALTAVVSGQTQQSRATAISRVLGATTLELALEVNPDPVQPNELLELRARIANVSASPTGALTLRLHWPDHLGAFPVLTGVGAVYCPGGQCNPSELLTWNLGVLPAHGSQTVSVVVAVAAGVPSGTLIPFELDLVQDAASAGAIAHTVEVEASRALELTVDAVPDPVAPGGELVYDLSFANKSGAVATAAELRMPLPEGTTFVSATSGGALSGGDVVWNVGTIPVASGGKRRAVVAVDGGLAPGSLLTVDAAALTAVVSGQTQQSRATAISRVLGGTTLELALEVNPDPVQPNELLELRARVANVSASPTGALTLRLHWPDHLGAFPFVTGVGAVYCPGGQCNPSELLTWNLGVLPAHGSQTVSVVVAVAAGVPSGTLIPLELGLVQDEAPAGAIAHTVEVEASRALELTVDAVPDPVAPGGELVYDLSFANKSGAVATGAELRMPVPEGTTFSSATGGGTLSGGDVVWNVGTLPVGSSDRRRAVVTVDPGVPAGSLLMIDAAAISAVVSAQLHQTRATAISRVLGGTTIELGLEVDPDPVQPNEVLELRARVSNTSASPTGALTLLLHWPDHLGPFPVVTGAGAVYCAGGQCNPSELLTWNLGVLPAHGSQSISVAVAVAAGVPSGSLIPFELDLVLDGAAAGAIARTVVVEASRPLELSVDALPDPVAPGAQLVLELSYGNKAAAVATDAQLRLPLPAGTTFVSDASGAGVLSVAGDEVVWNLGTLAATSAGRERVTVAVDGGLANGTLLPVNVATLDAVVSSVERHAWATTVAHVDGSSTLALQSSASPDPVQPLQELLVEIEVQNLAAQPTGALTLRLHWPDHMNAFPTTVPNVICAGGQCTPSELLEWSLGPLAANSSTTVTVQENVLAGVPNGTLIPWTVELFEAGQFRRRAIQTVVVHPFTDSDNDGTSDLDDFDDDNDGMPDGWELAHCLDPKSANAAGDPDGDGDTNVEEFVAGTHPLCNEQTEDCEGFVCSTFATIDVDGDGLEQPLTDGLLILRHRFGLTGAPLVSQAVGAGCTRCTAAEIQAYIDSILAQLDVDGAGGAQPLTDGLLILRALFGLSGTPLISGAVGPGCTRCTAEQILGYVLTLR